MRYLLIEFSRFLKNNYKKLAIGTLLIAGLFIVVSFSSELRDQSIQESSSENLNEPVVTEARPAYFQFYAENLNGDTFTNNILIENYFTSLNILRQASFSQDINVYEIVNENENNIRVNYNQSGEAKIISVYRYSDSNLIEVSVNIGEEDTNLSLLHFYYDLIVNNDIPFLENKDITFFHMPRIKEVEPLDRFNVIESQENYLSYLADIFIAILLGFILSVFVLILFEFYSKKIMYFPSYSLLNIDYFILFDRKIDNSKIVNDILSKPLNNNIVVLKQNNRQTINDKFSTLFNDLSKENNFIEYNNLLEINNLNHINRLVIIVEESKTDRHWYNNQLKFLNKKGLSTIVIQVNSDKKVASKTSVERK